MNLSLKFFSLLHHTKMRLKVRMVVQ
jgi:hypothetical protein